MQKRKSASLEFNQFALPPYDIISGDIRVEKVVDIVPYSLGTIFALRSSFREKISEDGNQITICTDTVVEGLSAQIVESSSVEFGYEQDLIIVRQEISTRELFERRSATLEVKSQAPGCNLTKQVFTRTHIASENEQLVAEKKRRKSQLLRKTRF